MIIGFSQERHQRLFMHQIVSTYVGTPTNLCTTIKKTDININKK